MAEDLALEILGVFAFINIQNIPFAYAYILGGNMNGTVPVRTAAVFSISCLSFFCSSAAETLTFSFRISMLASVARRRVVSRARSLFLRAKSTSVDPQSEGPIGVDGRHELWREGIYDHDNEPK